MENAATASPGRIRTDAVRQTHQNRSVKDPQLIRRDALAESKHLDPHDVPGRVEVEDDPGLDFLGLDDAAFVEAEVERVTPLIHLSSERVLPAAT